MTERPVQLAIRLCACVRCGEMTTDNVCPRCRAYYLSLPGDEALARGAQWPTCSRCGGRE